MSRCILSIALWARLLIIEPEKKTVPRYHQPSVFKCLNLLLCSGLIAHSVKPIKQCLNNCYFSFQMVGHRHMMYTGPASWRLAFVTTLMIVAVAGQQAYFNGTQETAVTSVTFPPTSAQLYHLGFSFRTCGSPTTATILSQVKFLVCIEEM